jgi:hypothetical protein
MRLVRSSAMNSERPSSMRARLSADAFVSTVDVARGGSFESKMVAMNTRQSSLELRLYGPKSSSDSQRTNCARVELTRERHCEDALLAISESTRIEPLSGAGSGSGATNSSSDSGRRGGEEEGR